MSALEGKPAGPLTAHGLSDAHAFLTLYQSWQASVLSSCKALVSLVVQWRHVLRCRLPKIKIRNRVNPVWCDLWSREDLATSHMQQWWHAGTCTQKLCIVTWQCPHWCRLLTISILYLTQSPHMQWCNTTYSLKLRMKKCGPGDVGTGAGLPFVQIPSTTRPPFLPVPYQSWRGSGLLQCYSVQDRRLEKPESNMPRFLPTSTHIIASDLHSQVSFWSPPSKLYKLLTTNLWKEDQCFDMCKLVRRLMKKETSQEACQELICEKGSVFRYV